MSEAREAPSVGPSSHAAIGVYDSGVGGLSVLRALRAHLPSESFIYVADSGHAPYGGKNQGYLAARATATMDFLVSEGVKAVVLACNTISVATAEALRQKYPLPIIAMEPAIKPATEQSANGKILVLATQYTVQSAPVQSLIQRFGDGKQIILQACPGLVEAVEQGGMSDPATLEKLKAYIEPGLAQGIDTVVLGCTHYPFLLNEIRAITGANIAIIEPSEAIARQLTRRLDALNTPRSTAPQRTRYFTTGAHHQLAIMLARLGEADPFIEPMSV